MWPKKMYIFLIIAALIITIPSSKAIAKEEYPDKPIKIIVPYKPGGGTDTNARVIEKFAKKFLGVPVAVINKPGSGGAIGYTELFKAKPDGYTIGYTNLPGYVMLAEDGKVRFSPSSFTPIALQVYCPKFIVTAENGKFKTIDELLDYARKNPGEIIAANVGPGSHNELVMLALDLFAGVELIHVPFDGSGPAKAAVMGGHAQIASIEPAEYVEGLKPLMVFAKKRLETFPDMPTSFEKGLKLDMAARRPLQAPANIPPDRAAFLAEKFKAMFNDPEYIDAMEKSGAVPVYAGPEELKEVIDGEVEFYKEFKQKIAAKPKK